MSIQTSPIQINSVTWVNGIIELTSGRSSVTLTYDKFFDGTVHPDGSRPNATRNKDSRAVEEIARDMSLVGSGRPKGTIDTISFGPKNEAYIAVTLSEASAARKIVLKIPAGSYNFNYRLTLRNFPSMGTPLQGEAAFLSCGEAARLKQVSRLKRARLRAAQRTVNL